MKLPAIRILVNVQVWPSVDDEIDHLGPKFRQRLEQLATPNLTTDLIVSKV